jgi:hypothetical protein
MIFSDPDPTFKEVSAPDPDPVSDPKAICALCVYFIS